MTCASEGGEGGSGREEIVGQCFVATVSMSVGQLAGEAAFEKAEKLRWLVKRK